MLESEIQILERVGAVLRNTHAVGNTWVHLDTYVEISALEAHPKETSELCRRIAGLTTEEVDTVVGPAGNGEFLIKELARQLSLLLEHPVHTVFATKVDENLQIFKEDYHLVSGKRVLLADDVLNTGATLRRILAALRALQVEVVGAAVVCSHGIVSAEGLEVPWIHSSAFVRSTRWTPEECALRGPCNRKVPINRKVGHGTEFLAQQAR